MKYKSRIYTAIAVAACLAAVALCAAADRIESKRISDNISESLHITSVGADAARSKTLESKVLIPTAVFTEEELASFLSDLYQEPETQSSVRASSNVAHAEASSSPANPSPASVPSVGPDDAYYIAAAVCREAGGESEEIMMLVANVIMNRVASASYPNTVYGVLTQRYQYGTMWRDGVSFPSWATTEIMNRCYSAANRILSGERVCPSNVVFQAEFSQGSGVYAYYPGFYFCYG